MTIKNLLVRFTLPFTIFTVVSATSGSAFAQSSDAASAPVPSPLLLPESPGSSSASGNSSPDADDPAQQAAAGQQPAAPPVHQDPQQKRIFGIMPNFRAVTAGTTLPPQTTRDKFVTASEDSFDYSSFVLAALVSSYAYVTVKTPEFHTGGAAYGRYYWHTFVDQTSENYFVEFIVPSITHEDTRFYSLGKGGFGKRFVYAVSRTFITRSDSGKTVFNAGEVVGAGLAAGVSNLYYPSPERTVGNTIDNYGTSLGIDMASFVVKEFYPDIYHVLFHHKVAQAAAPTP